jgi:hypothetical protein
MTPDLPGKLQTKMHALFTSNKKLLSVILYGPRTQPDAPPDSSIRLALGGPMGSRDIRQLRHQLSEMHTSIVFDILHLDHLEDMAQKKIILEEGIEIYKRKGS